jgi:putative NADH-flavin reductase
MAKRIFVLGSTGPTGLLFVQQALEKGHELTLYLRNEAKIPEDIKSNPKVKVNTISVEDTVLRVL